MKKTIAFGGRKQLKDFDYYETPDIATQSLIDSFDIYGKILEPCNGKNAISKYFKNITRWDINKDNSFDECLDFLETTGKEEYDFVITNPPYSTNTNGEFILKSLEHVKPEGYVIMLLKLLYYESNKRRTFFETYPPLKILVFSNRLNFNGGTGICYAWFIWKKGYTGPTTIGFVNKKGNI